MRAGEDDSQRRARILRGRGIRFRLVSPRFQEQNSERSEGERESSFKDEAKVIRSGENSWRKPRLESSPRASLHPLLRKACQASKLPDRVARGEFGRWLKRFRSVQAWALRRMRSS